MADCQAFFAVLVAAWLLSDACTPLQPAQSKPVEPGRKINHREEQGFAQPWDSLHAQNRGVQRISYAKWPPLVFCEGSDLFDAFGTPQAALAELGPT